MDFEITPEQQERFDSVHGVLERECTTGLVRDVVERGACRSSRGGLSTGATEIQRNIIAQRVLGLPRR